MGSISATRLQVSLFGTIVRIPASRPAIPISLVITMVNRIKGTEGLAVVICYAASILIMSGIDNLTRARLVLIFEISRHRFGHSLPLRKSSCASAILCQQRGGQFQNHRQSIFVVLRAPYAWTFVTSPSVTAKALDAPYCAPPYQLATDRAIGSSWYAGLVDLEG
jgi:hypothetical protein